MNITRLRTSDIAEYLIHESFLLDSWRLPEWRALFTNECRYLVPASGADPYADPSVALHYIADDGFPPHATRGPADEKDCACRVPALEDIAHDQQRPHQRA
jgi:hypothetical protein